MTPVQNRALGGYLLMLAMVIVICIAFSLDFIGGFVLLAIILFFAATYYIGLAVRAEKIPGDEVKEVE